MYEYGIIEHGKDGGLYHVHGVTNKLKEAIQLTKRINAWLTLNNHNAQGYVSFSIFGKKHTTIL